MSKEPSWREAIIHVLAQAKTPLHYTEITERILAEGLKKTLGATPAATVNAQMAHSIKHQREKSPFARAAKGIFMLREGARSQSRARDAAGELEEDQYQVFRCFGMFWNRQSVDWNKPRILGAQNIGATPVDFHRQIGVYLLYDGREVIYVGRATERPLGKRLSEHTQDRLATRWDRFSWFGLLPISEQGDLGQLPKTYQADLIIPALEAVLIEAVEPRQNRKRGDDLSAVEYLQILDPEIEKRRIKASVDAALNRL